MNIDSTLAQNARDNRIFLFLGLANWFIFLDHIPDDWVSRLTLRNFGFSGSADVFVFVSGYTAALLYAKIIRERGTIVGVTRVLGRAWQLYITFIVLFVMYVVSIGDAATRYAAPEIIYDFKMGGLLQEPVRTVAHGLLLQSQALNLDVLQLYVVLMAGFPVALWLLLRAPDFALAASFALYIAARWFEWTLKTYPDGDWFFNPFCWQLLFVLGAWSALGGANRLASRFRSPVWVSLGVAYLVFALVMTMAHRFPMLGQMLPAWLHDAFIPNDRANLAPYRLLHFITVALFATRLIAKDWRGLDWRVVRPLILCGEESLSVFCAGVFLSFTAHFMLLASSGSLVQQTLVSLIGIAAMTLVARYVSWSRQQDRPHPAGMSPAPSLKAS